MKAYFITVTLPSLLFFALASLAFGMPMPVQEVRNYELMKCTSSKNGTIWASFGHMLKSGDQKVYYFPTEILVLSPDLYSRLMFPNFEEALQKVDVEAGPGRFHLKFQISREKGERTHLIQLIQVDLRNNQAFMGNWSISENGVEISDQVACSLD